ncbi:MAG TPA: pyridoxamine 5'-phosphate oxidase family protein [Thermomicrobiales bacterium]|nr:pyridoxamine 5'-phosphate oxidase family protein [Thermomicrobiales bacterium]
MTHREYDDFVEFEPEFRERVDRMVWCTVATVDTKGRPSTRLLHPNWEGRTGWIGTHKSSSKRLHLANNPYVSLAYVSDVVHPVYVEATATWEDDPAVKQHVWNLFLNTPEPLGYDPAVSFIAPDHENFGVLRIDPWKITLATLAGDPWQKIWRAKKDRSHRED